MTITIVWSKEGGNEAKKSDFQSPDAALVYLNQFLKKLGFRWEIVVNDDTELKVVKYVGYHNTLRMICTGNAEEIGLARATIKPVEPQMFIP